MITSLHDVQLEPPVGTCYYRSCNATLKAGNYAFSITINVTFHIYVTRAKPDSDFTANGGKIYVIAVYNGSGEWDDHRPVFGIEDNSNLLLLINQLPITGAEEERGDNMLYTIDFAHTMSMYNDGGKSPCNFLAKYRRTFSLTGYRQVEREPNKSSRGWTIYHDNTASSRRVPSIIGLQIFESNKLGVANCRIFCGILGPDGRTFSKDYSLDFSAETMGHIVD